MGDVELWGWEKKNYDDPSSDSFSFFNDTQKPMDVIF